MLILSRQTPALKIYSNMHATHPQVLAMLLRVLSTHCLLLQWNYMTSMVESCSAHTALHRTTTNINPGITRSARTQEWQCAQQNALGVTDHHRLVPVAVYTEQR